MRRTSASTTAYIVLMLCGLLFVVSLNLTPIYTNDFWIQLKVGDIIRETSTIPRTILFTFTEARDNEFIAHEWLPSVLSSALYSLVGYQGMIIVKCALALMIFSLAFLLSFQINRKVSVSMLVACLTMLAINFRTHMRPEIFAFIYALISLNLLQAFLRTGKRYWLAGLLPVGLLWANSHGSFLINLFLPLIFLMGTILDDWRAGRIGTPEKRSAQIKQIYLPLLITAIAIFMVSLVNPYGFRLLLFSFWLGQADFMRQNIVEFGSTFDERIRATFYFKIFLFYFSVLFFSFASSRKRTSFIALLLFLAFGYYSLDTIRFTAWLGIVGAYILAQNLAGFVEDRTSRIALSAVLAVVLIAATLTIVQKGNVRGKPIGFRNMSPMTIGALDFIRSSGIEGNVFNAFKLGDQLVYHFYPKILVTIDSRVDAYGEEYYQNYRSMCGRSYKQLGDPEKLLGFLDRYTVNAIITRPFDFNNWRTKNHLSKLFSRDWKLVFTDEEVVILRRGSQQ